MYENGRKLGHAQRATPALWLLPVSRVLLPGAVSDRCRQPVFLVEFAPAANRVVVHRQRHRALSAASPLIRQHDCNGTARRPRLAASKKASNFLKDMLSLRRGRPTPKSPPALPPGLAGRVEPFARDRPRGISNAKLPSATRWPPFEGSCGARRMYQCPGLTRMAWKFQPPPARDSRKRSATRHKIRKVEVRPSDHRD
jgi:hypothetical protein